MYLVFTWTEFRVGFHLKNKLKKKKRLINEIAHLILDSQIESESGLAPVLGLANVTLLSY